MLRIEYWIFIFIFCVSLSAFVSEYFVFCRKVVLRNFAKFSGKYLCQSLFCNKVAGLRPATLLKKRLCYRRFPVNFTKFLRKLFFTEHLWWPLLQVSKSHFSLSQYHDYYISILLLWNPKNQLTLQYSCPLMIKFTMEILFADLMASLFLPKYKCCMNESFLS